MPALMSVVAAALILEVEIGIQLPLSASAMLNSLEITEKPSGLAQ